MIQLTEDLDDGNYMSYGLHGQDDYCEIPTNSYLLHSYGVDIALISR